MTMEPRSYDRTLYEAKLDIAYGVAFQEANARFYRRLDWLFGFVGLFGGTAVFSAAVAQWQWVSIVSGALVASFAIAERLIRPAEHIADHVQWRNKFSELQVNVEAGAVQSLQAIDAGLRLLQAQAPSGITALASMAYNATVVSAGRTDYRVPVSRWERLINVLA